LLDPRFVEPGSTLIYVGAYAPKLYLVFANFSLSQGKFIRIHFGSTGLLASGDIEHCEYSFIELIIKISLMYILHFFSR